MASSSTTSLADLGVSVSSMDPMVSSQTSSSAWIHTVSVSDNFSNVVVSDASSLSEPMLLPFSSVMLPTTPNPGIMNNKSHPLGKFSQEQLLTKLPPDDQNSGPLSDIVKSPFLHFESQSSSLGGPGLDWESKCQAPTLASPMMGKRSKVNHSALNHPGQPISLMESHGDPSKTIYMISDVKTPAMEPGLSIKLLDEMMPSGANTTHHKLMPGNISLVMPSVPPTMVSASNPVMSNSLFGSPHVTDSSFPCLTKMVTSSQEMNLSLPNYELVSDSLDLSLSFPGLTSPTPTKLKPQTSFSLLEPMNMRCLSETTVCQPSPSPRVIEDASGTSLRLLSNAEPVRLMPGGREQMTASPQVRIMPPKTPLSDQQYHFQIMENAPNFTPVRLIPQVTSHLTSTSNVNQHKQQQALQRNKLILMPEQTLMDATPKAQPKLYLKQIFNGSVSSISLPNPLPGSSEPVKEKKNVVQPISCFKCTECGFLGLSHKQVEDHALFEHEFDLTEDNEEWLVVAQRESIKLECPFCPNKFNAEGSRSFKVHVLDDHGVNETEADKHFRESHQKRRSKTLEWMRAKRAEEKEERRRARRDVLEAYVDEQGQLRVRNTTKGKKSPGSDVVSTPCASSTITTPIVDVSANEYVDALEIGKKIAKSKKLVKLGTLPDPLPQMDEKQKLLIGLSQKAKKRPANAQTDEDSLDDDDDNDDDDDDDDDIDIDIETLAPVLMNTIKSESADHVGGSSSSSVPRRKVGRPKGSRTVGLTKLKRVNRNIELSEERMGVECGLHACANRFKSADKLEYHRKCHLNDETLRCLECQNEFTHWKPLALHLWSKHKIDMELFKCDQCETFRSFSQAKLQAHKICHNTERTFLCDDCGKGFKSKKNLRHHQQIHRRKNNPEENPPKFVCQICQRAFREFRLLRHHTNNVHEKLKPHLCNYCGYSASSKSSLKLHLRLHTGEKPYSCGECDYKSADHNSLRRHKLVHSGEKPYKCQYCDYSSIQSRTYMIHLKNKHPKEAESHLFHCDQCMFKTVKEGNFLTHLAEHGRKSHSTAKELARKVKTESADSTTTLTPTSVLVVVSSSDTPTTIPISRVPSSMIEGLSASKTEEWMRLLPDSKVPKLNTSGEKHREMQLQYQIPQQDISLKHCHHVDKKDHDSFENFTRARNDIALDIAHAIDSIKENSVCLKCQKVIVAGSVAVMAPKFGFNTHWHPACFTCATCDEILVDLTYCVFNDKIFCERHYAENLKPRCGSCDELIFSGEYTKALNKDWHCDHFFCWLCQTVLTGKTYVLTEDNQCCIPCYEKNFTHSCQLCQNKIGIEEKDMGYKDMHWHEDCFTCQKCKGSLSGKPFAVKNTYIFCGSCYDSEFASRCEACAEPFKPGTKRMDYKNRKWHETCFQCVVCKVTVGTKPFIIPDETDVYCVNCFEDKFATKCTKCKKVMTTGGVTFKNESWHRECFTCANCDVVLAGQKFASKNEQPYCAKCYGELFAKRCTACSEPITGTGGTRFISFEGRHWHSQCFKCAMCNLSMAGKGFITDGEDIICPDCAKNKLTGV